jgi:protein phosphatase 2C-like protein
MGAWTWAIASRRGVSHAKVGERRQDAFACRSRVDPSALLVAVLCDGAGSAEMGGQGASLVARTIALRAYASAWQGLQALTDELIRSWVADARDRVATAAKKRDKLARDFATTMICVVSDGMETVVAHVGDGCAVVQDASDRAWHALSWPSHGEYASTTFFVTDDPQPKLIIRRYSQPISAIVAFTDGLERLALEFATEKPHAPFFDAIIGPVAASSVVGRDGALSAALARYLDGDAINARTDDDKTLLVAAYR